MSYEKLDPQAQNEAIQRRLQDLEAQHHQISLRVNAPALGEPEGGNDTDNSELAKLEKGISWLKNQLQEVA